MSDNEQTNQAASWWAAPEGAEHEQITLYRKDGGTESLLDRFTVTREQYPTLEDFQLEIKKAFGGGVFVATSRGDRGQFAKRYTFAIAGMAKRDNEEKQNGNGLGELAAVLLKSQEASEARLLAVLEKMSDTAPAPDAFEMMERAANLLHRNGAAPAPAKSLVEQLQEMRTAAELMGLTDKADTEENGSGWAKDLINTFGPALVGSMGGMANSQGDELAHDTATAAPVNEQEQALKRLKMILLSLVQLAEYDVKPGKAVQGIEKSAGKHWPMLVAIIKRDDATVLAAQMVPAVADHQEWFEQFRAAVIGEPGTTGAKNGSTEKQPGIKKSAASVKPGAAEKRGARNTTNA